MKISKFLFHVLFTISLTLSIPTFAALTTTSGKVGTGCGSSSDSDSESGLEWRAPKCSQELSAELVVTNLQPDDLISLTFCDGKNLQVPKQVLYASPAFNAMFNGSIDSCEKQSRKAKLENFTRKQFQQVLPFIMLESRISLRCPQCTAEADDSKVVLPRGTEETMLPPYQIRKQSRAWAQICADKFKTLEGKIAFYANVIEKSAYLNLNQEICNGIVEALANLANPVAQPGAEDHCVTILNQCPEFLHDKLSKGIEKHFFIWNFYVEAEKREDLSCQARIDLFKELLSQQNPITLPNGKIVLLAPETTFALSEILGSAGLLDGVESLDVSQCNLSEFDIEGPFPSITNLQMRFNNFLSPPNFSELFPGLVSLDAYKCGMTGVLDLSQLTQLTTLRLEDNKLTCVCVDNCTALTRLDIRDNTIAGTLDLSTNTSLDTVLCSKNKLVELIAPAACQILNVADNLMLQLLDVRLCQQNLTELNCSIDSKLLETQEHLESIVGLEQCAQLTKLQTSGNPQLQIAVNELGNLCELSIDGATYQRLESPQFSPDLNTVAITNYYDESLDLTPLPNSVANLTIENGTFTHVIGFERLSNLTDLTFRCVPRLETLDLTPHTQLLKFSIGDHACQQIDGLEYCVNLVQLHVGSGRLSGILNVSPLQQLKKLNIGDNRLESLVGLNELRSLEACTIGNNNLAGDLDLGVHEELIDFSLGRNKITGILGLSASRKLEELHIATNKLEGELDLSSFPALVRLDLFECGLTNISGFEYCPKLSQLILKGNPFESLQGLARCKKLSRLILSDTQIQGPLNLFELSNIDDLTLTNNPGITYIFGIEKMNPHHLLISKGPVILSLDLQNLPRLHGLILSPEEEGRIELYNLDSCQQLEFVRLLPPLFPLNQEIALNTFPRLRGLILDKASPEHLREAFSCENLTFLGIHEMMCPEQALEVPYGRKIEVLHVYNSQFASLKDVSNLAKLQSLILVNNTFNEEVCIDVDELPNLKFFVCDNSVTVEGSTLNNFNTLESLQEDPAFADIFMRYKLPITRLDKTSGGIVDNVRMRFNHLYPYKTFRLLVRVEDVDFSSLYS